MNKQELLELLKMCGADQSAIDVVELAYSLGFADGFAANTKNGEFYD